MVIDLRSDSPIFESLEWDFYRCVDIGDLFNSFLYNKSIWRLFRDNLRLNNQDNTGRYSHLFEQDKISYWARSLDVARKEMKKHNNNSKNYIIFHAYDDTSSNSPKVKNSNTLKLIDGSDSNMSKILKKWDNKIELNNNEKKLIHRIITKDPDGLVYESIIAKDRREQEEKRLKLTQYNSIIPEKNLNFIFFERGFNKLLLKDIKLYIGDGNNKKEVQLAYGSDYIPLLKNYRLCFKYKAKLKEITNFEDSEDFIEMLNILNI